jgi:hypothetical protein
MLLESFVGYFVDHALPSGTWVEEDFDSMWKLVLTLPDTYPVTAQNRTEIF